MFSDLFTENFTGTNLSVGLLQCPQLQGWCFSMAELFPSVSSSFFLGRSYFIYRQGTDPLILPTLVSAFLLFPHPHVTSPPWGVSRISHMPSNPPHQIGLQIGHFWGTFRIIKQCKAPCRLNYKQRILWNDGRTKAPESCSPAPSKHLS